MNCEQVVCDTCGQKRRANQLKDTKTAQCVKPSPMQTNTANYMANLMMMCQLVK